LSGGAAPPTPPAASTSYSRAFETFVQDPDDLVGLLAYALYKRHIREAFLADRPLIMVQSHVADWHCQLGGLQGVRHRAAVRR